MAEPRLKTSWQLDIDSAQRAGARPTMTIPLPSWGRTTRKTAASFARSCREQSKVELLRHDDSIPLAPLEPGEQDGLL